MVACHAQLTAVAESDHIDLCRNLPDADVRSFSLNKSPRAWIDGVDWKLCIWAVLLNCVEMLDRQVLTCAKQYLRVPVKAVAMGVVFTHDVTGDAGRLHVGASSSRTQLISSVDDPALYRLESIADIRHGAATDCVEPVLNEVLLELLMEDHLLDRLDDLFLLLASFGH